MSADAIVSLAAAFRDVALAGVVGPLLIVAAVVPRGHPAADRAMRIARVSSVVWAIAALAFSMATYASIRGVSVDAARFIEEWWQYSRSVDLLEANLQVAVAALVTSVVVGFVRTPTLAAWSLAPVAWAVGWQAVTGHAAGASDHHLAVSAMALHLVGASAWVGLIGTIALLRRPLGADGAVAVRRVSAMALWAAMLVIASGVANAWIRLDAISDLLTTQYGRVLALKLALMSLAVGLAAWHRRVSLPSLTDADAAGRFYRLLVVDVAALVAVMGVAAVLSGTAPPLAIEPIGEPSPAYFLTGFDLPPAPTAYTWFGLWRLEIISAAVLAALAVVYVRWAVRLHRRGDAWPWYRTASFLVGVAVLVWITQGGPAVYGLVTFSGHMVEHMVLVMAAPIPLTLGAPITLALRALSPRTDGSRGPREWVRAVVESRLMRLLANPIVAAFNFTFSLVFFYYSPAFEFALRNHAGHLWMLVHFTLAGYLFVNALVGIDPGPKRPRFPLRIVLLFATMAFHAFFGVALSSSHVLLAPTWYGLMGRTWGPDAITDQQYGGQIAWGIGELPTVALALGVFLMWRRADDREGARLDRQAERDHDADLKAYNAMLESVARRDADDARAGRDRPHH